MAVPNFTSPGHVNAQRIEKELISDEAVKTFINLISRNILTHILSILGIIGNSLSIVILFKQGFRKSSNILVFVLAVTDTTTLAGIYNSLVMGAAHSERSESSARVLFAFWQIFRMFGMAAEYTGLCIPSVITIERLIAVFFPLRFHRIVTPFRTWLILTIIYGIWFAKFLHSSFFFQYLDYVYHPVLNISSTVIRFTKHYLESYDVHHIINHLVVILGSTVPSVLTAVGCIVISIKLRINANKRKKMTSPTSAKTTSQTTKMLLAVCFVYLVLCTYKWILNIPQIEDVMRRDVGGFSNLGWVTFEVLVLLSYFNNSFNFVVYVALNKKFRDTFLSLFPRPCVSTPDNSEKKTP